MWKVITSFNLNPLLKLFFYSPILSNNNPLLKIYCKNIVVTFLNCNFLFFILFFPSYHLDTFLLLFFFFFFLFLFPTLSFLIPIPLLLSYPCPLSFFYLPRLDEVVSSHSLFFLRRSLLVLFFYLAPVKSCY